MRPRRRLPAASLALCALLAAFGRGIAGDESPGIGTRHVLAFVAAAPDGRWVVLRQARHDTDHDGEIRVDRGVEGQFVGDQMPPYLVQGDGPGERLDDFVGADPTGRWIAVVEKGSLVLRDTVAGTREDLGARGADPTTDGVPGRPHRAASFDRLGRRMAWIRFRDSGEREGSDVVVRDLAAGGAEHVIDPGPGVLHRVDLTPDGGFLLLEVAVRDTDGDGRIAGPRRLPPPPGVAQGPFGRARVAGDAVERRLAPAAGGAARAVPDLVVPLAAGLLVRRPDWSLALRAVGGEETSVAAASRAALVLHAAPHRDALVLVDGAGEERGQVTWVRGLRTAVLPVRLRSLPPEEPALHVGRWIALATERPGRTIAVDLETGAAEGWDADVLAFHGESALLRRGEGVAIRDLATGAETRFDHPAREAFFLRQAGPRIALDGFVYDLDRRACLGAFVEEPRLMNGDEHALAVDTAGRVLLPREIASLVHLRGGGWHPRGPLRWQTPRP